MPLGIQRVPRGLNDVLSVFGGQTPQILADAIAGTIECLQFYANQQLSRVSNNNAAAAEGVTTVVVVPANQWWILLRCNGAAVKTATMTALRVSVFVNTIVVASVEGGPFGATETGTVHCPFIPPYAMLLRPGDVIQCNAPIIGTDATANITISAEVGVMG